MYHNTTVCNHYSNGWKPGIPEKDCEQTMS